VQSVEGRGSWKLRVRASRVRRISLEASLAALKHPFRPCSVLLRGRVLPNGAWSYSRRARVLKIRFRTRSGTLVARRTCVIGQ
jgi:hypothetical protein